MSIAARAGFIVAGLIHLVPVTGVAGMHQLAKLYDVRTDDPNVVLLLRHRAVLFGLVGGLLCAAAFLPSLHGTALAAGLTSVVSFLGLARPAPALASPIRRVIAADWIALAALMTAAAGDAWTHLRS